MRRHSRNPNVLAIVLAGGEGKRLMPLTADRAKPAVPFGGIYRLIDFALSNVVNSGYLKVVVLTQYKSHSLDRHVTRTWRMSTLLGNYVAPIPAQQRRGKQWYMGSADAIYQSLNTIEDERPDIVVVVGADHVYRMDFSQMVQQHIETDAGITVAAIRQPISLADQFGVIEVDESDVRKVGRWREKPTDAKGLPDSPDEVLASMGNYVFDADILREVVTKDANDESSKHDMGGDIVPYFVERDEAYVYDFNNNEIPGATDRDRAYWRDVGTIDSYYDANRDLIALEPIFNLYNSQCRSTRATARATRRPSSSTTSRVASARRSTRPCHRAASSPVLTSRARSSPRRSRCTATPGCTTPCCSTTSTSRATPTCATRSSTRTCGSRPAPRSASTTTATASGATASARAGSSSSPRAPSSPRSRHRVVVTA